MIAGVHASGSIKKSDIAGAQRTLPAAAPVIQAKKADSSKSPARESDASRSEQRRFDDVLKSQKPDIDDAKASKGDATTAPSAESVEAEKAQKSTDAAQESTDADDLHAAIEDTDNENPDGQLPTPEVEDAVSESQVRESSTIVISPGTAAATPIAPRSHAEPQAPRAASPQGAADRGNPTNQANVSAEARTTQVGAGQQTQSETDSGGEQAPSSRFFGAQPRVTHETGQRVATEQLPQAQNDGPQQQDGELPQATSVQAPVAASHRSASAGVEQQARPILTELQPSAEAPKAESTLQVERILDSPTVAKSSTSPDLKQPTGTPTKPAPDPAAQIVSRGLSAAVAQRGGSMTMQLIPETLGQVRVQMHLEQGVVSVRIETANAAAQRLLTDNLTMLRTSLESKGLSIERLSVHLSPNALGAGTAPSAGSSSGHEAGHGGPQSQMGGQNHNAAGQGSRGNGGDAEHQGTAGETGLSAESGTEEEAAMAAKFGSKLRLRLHAVA